MSGRGQWLVGFPFGRKGVSSLPEVLPAGGLIPIPAVHSDPVSRRHLPDHRPPIGQRDTRRERGGQRVVIDGIGFAAIGRLQLLQLLQARAASVDVAPVYRRTVKSLSELAEFDLVVGADGVNSLVRRALAPEFGATVRLLDNRFAWFGTTQRFETLSHTFIETAEGAFNAHHYRYAPDMSTFIVEMSADTFARIGFADMHEAASRQTCERLFAEALGGHALISNNAIWRRFPIVRNARWSHGKHVLIGDALVNENERLQARINQFLDRIEATLKQALRIAATQGDVDAATDAGAHANLLLCYVIGRWQQFGKSGFSRDPMAQWPQQWAILSR